MMKKILLFLVKGYQKVISPLFPPSCRYYPTCSNYTVQAIEKHGAFKGSIMGLARIIRCNPFVPGGVDHVPDHFTMRRNQKEKYFGYIGGNESSPEETEQMKKRAAELYEDYKEYAIVHESLPNAVEVLNEIINTQERTINDLDEDYIERVREMLTFPSLPERPSRSPEDLSLHFFEVIRDEKSEKYFNHIHHSTLDHALKDATEEHAIGVLLEEELGIWETNAPDLSRDFIIKQGITKKDVEEKNTKLLSYLLTVREEIDGIATED